MLQKASPEEFVDLFISTSALSLTLKCHWYSGVALRGTIKKRRFPETQFITCQDSFPRTQNLAEYFNRLKDTELCPTA